jgi:AcrR family transcriptional regulator
VSVPEPRKKPLQARAIAAVEAMLQAAAHILVHEGYGRLTTNRVADLAGVSIGSLYQYFPNKQALIVALQRRHSEEQMASFSAAMTGVGTVPIEEWVAHLIKAIIAGHQDNFPLHVALATQIPEMGGGTMHAANITTSIAVLADALAQLQPDANREALARFAFTAVHLVDSLVHAFISARPTDVQAGVLESELTGLLLREFDANVVRPHLVGDRTPLN